MRVEGKIYRGETGIKDGIQVTDDKSFFVAKGTSWVRLVQFISDSIAGDDTISDDIKNLLVSFEGPSEAPFDFGDIVIDFEKLASRGRRLAAISGGKIYVDSVCSNGNIESKHIIIYDGITTFTDLYADDVIAFVLAAIWKSSSFSVASKRLLFDFVIEMDKRAVSRHGFSRSPEQQAIVFEPTFNLTE